VIVETCRRAAETSKPAGPDAVQEVAIALLSQQAQHPVERLTDRGHGHRQHQFHRDECRDECDHHHIEKHVAQAGLDEKRANLDRDLADQLVTVEDRHREGGLAKCDHLAEVGPFENRGRRWALDDGDGLA
jgi:hypothetical protein